MVGVVGRGRDSSGLELQCSRLRYMLNDILTESSRVDIDNMLVASCCYSSFPLVPSSLLDPRRPLPSPAKRVASRHSDLKNSNDAFHKKQV
jgi:hypothetical protein